MSIRSNLVSRFLVSFFAVFGPSFANAATPQARIRTAITDADRAPVRETISPRVKQSADLGEASSGRTLSAVTLHFSLTTAQQADLTQLLADLQNPSSPHYHQWLNPQQYGARFGLASADMAKVQSWLTGKGLQVVAVAPSQNSITVSGTIGQIESAFNTSIHSLTENGVQHISNVTDPQLPSPIANLVVGITGLNDFKPHSRAIVRPHFTSSTTGNHYIAPGDFYTIYDLNPLLQQQNINGSGISIAAIGQTDISLADVAAFRSAAGLPANVPTIVKATGYVAGTVSADIDEAQLDVEWSGAVAPNASIQFVTVGASSTASVVDALLYAITNNVAPIISLSYGNCESAWGQSSLNTLNQYFQQANAQGITIFSASGDSGATDCDTAPPADFGLAVDFPGSSPFVTSAGGTMFNEGSATGTTSYWNSNSSSSTNNAGSALSYIPEVVWNESNSTGLSAGGGGASAYFAKPAWQVGTGVPQDNVRDVPDISLNAAASHDGYLFCSQGSCTNGFRNSAGNLNVVGGTSAVAPSLAGIFALIEQQLGGGTTGRLGNINPMVYGLANGQFASSVFHDITSGNNNSSCQLGTTDCPSGGSIGYSAGTGYDLTTGWGSLDVANLAAKWSSATPTGTTSTTGTALSNTTVTATNNGNTCGVSGALNLTITVTNASTSTSLGAPTGNVQIVLDGKPISGAVVTLSNGTVSYSFTNSQISGSHKVGAVYLGDSTYSGSQGTLAADFTYSNQSDFSLSPCTNNTTVASGATASGITFTVASLNGFNGPVTFNVVATSSIAASYSFSASSVNLAAGASGTSTLTITASQTTTTTSSLRKNDRPGSRWYVAGSGITLAGLLFFVMPKRRRFTPLLVLLLSMGAFSISGCGGGSSSSNNNNPTPGGTTKNATAGTYILDVTATASNGLVHTSTITLKVQ
ncbi:protease pro-enzyme activation domain-containing protein [Edaphobacter albus]|uniref:protease pro-enzyme activation domain-containing protein n=1 Tax=Edaphobacter sp. 4G125 TaxID=2763071 RepID=UPI001647E9F6|nr:protease pro-enzyme activation domain-containing protein [Edaphobacter sp. 4G125]QNI38237.1 Ig-like domain repeat protein [Edaphobacter sp. 4G125]